MTRSVLLLLALLLIALLPYCGTLLVDAYYDNKIASEQLANARAKKALAQSKHDEILQYDTLVKRANNYAKSANDLQLTKQYWERYEVKITESETTAADLHLLLSTSKHGPEYLFQPEKLVIQRAPHQEEITSEENKTIVSLQGTFIVKKEL